MVSHRAGGVPGSIGGTPLVELGRLSPSGGGRVFAKLEGQIREDP